MRKLTAHEIPITDRLALTLDEVCGLTGLGLASIRGAIAAGQLRSGRLGRRVIIRRTDVDDFLRKLPTRGASK